MLVDCATDIFVAEGRVVVDVAWWEFTVFDEKNPYSEQEDTHGNDTDWQQ